jgi:hypothetical protein
MDVKAMKEEIARKGKLPCARCIGENTGLMIKDVRKVNTCTAEYIACLKGTAV